MRKLRRFTLSLFCIIAVATAAHADERALALLKQYAHSTNTYRMVEFYHAPGATKNLIIIEDAHANTPVQKAIKRILKRVNYSIVSNGITHTPLVLQEGGSYGPIDTAILKKGISPTEVKPFIDEKFARGEIGAAEYTHTLKGGFSFFGIENEELYNQNYTHFMEIAELRTGITVLFDDFEKRFTQLRELIFTHELKEFHARMTQSDIDENFNIEGYLKELRLLSLQYDVSLKEYPTLARYFETLEALSKIDLEKLGHELAQFNHTEGTSHDVAAAHELYAGEELSIETYPLLYSYGKLNTLLLATKMVAFVKEKEKLEKVLFEKIAYTDEEKELVEALRNFFVLKKILSFTLTKDEYTYYAHESSPERNILKDMILYLRSYFNQLEITLPVETLLISAEGFYAAVNERDSALTKNMLRAMDEMNVSCATSIIGGFHTKGITERLKDEGVSFLVLSPKVTHVDELGTQHYYDVMQRFWQG